MKTSGGFFKKESLVRVISMQSELEGYSLIKDDFRQGKKNYKGFDNFKLATIHFFLGREYFEFNRKLVSFEEVINQIGGITQIIVLIIQYISFNYSDELLLLRLGVDNKVAKRMSIFNKLEYKRKSLQLDPKEFNEKSESIENNYRSNVNKIELNNFNSNTENNIILDNVLNMKNSNNKLNISINNKKYCNTEVNLYKPEKFQEIIDLKNNSINPNEEDTIKSESDNNSNKNENYIEIMEVS